MLIASDLFLSIDELPCLRHTTQGIVPVRTALQMTWVFGFRMVKILREILVREVIFALASKNLRV